MKNRKSRRTVWIVILSACFIILILAAALAVKRYFSAGSVRLTFSENDKAVINPARGFYAQIDTGDADKIPGYYEEENFRFLLLGFNLADEMEHDTISEDKIAELRKALEGCRSSGMAVIFRAAYHFWGDEYRQPDDFSLILGHAEQIFPVINEYRDVVLGVQAGFLGPYGEWHSSVYMEEGIQNPYYIRLLETLDRVIHPDITIDVRRPMFLREAFAAGIKPERMGLHNDALLSTDTDMGTYVDENYTREDELAWAQAHISTPINGGEMTNVSIYTEASHAASEFDQLDLTYLNRYYNVEVLDSWKEQSYEGQNALDYMEQHLGYRLSLKEAVLPECVGIGQNITLEGSMRNTGFARPEQGFLPYLAVKTGENQSVIALKADFTDEKKWEFSGEVPVSLDFWNGSANEDIMLGIQIKRVSPVSGGRDFYIQFAGDETEYDGQCNWFAAYRYDSSKKKYVLEERNP